MTDEGTAGPPRNDKENTQDDIQPQVIVASPSNLNLPSETTLLSPSTYFADESIPIPETQNV